MSGFNFRFQNQNELLTAKMSGNNILFDLTWDVNKYKSNYDSEHWDLCRTFMETHKTKYPEQKLVHLTEAFYQIGVYGSR